MSVCVYVSVCVLTQWPDRFLLEHSLAVGLVDGVEQSRHVLPKAPDAIGPAGFHLTQALLLGLTGALEVLLFASERHQNSHRKGVTHRNMPNRYYRCFG